MFIIQDISLVDKQAREALCEHLVVCRRLDRLTVPILSPLYKMFTGKRLPFPRLHLAKVHYGDNEQSIKVDRWIYRGTAIFPAYDTKQIFSAENNGFARMLTPWYLVGRYGHDLSLIQIAMKLLIKLIQMFYVFVSFCSGVAPCKGATPEAKAAMIAKLRVTRVVRDGYIIG